METKDVIGLTLLVLAIVGGTGVACVSQRARDAAFFLLIVGSLFSNRLGMTFDCQFWYRGTTRGFEVTLADVLAVSLLVSTRLLPRSHQARWFWPASLGPLLIYFLYCGFSAVFSEPKNYGLYELSKIVRGLIVFLAAAWYVRSERELKILVLALGSAICIEGVWGLKQRYLNGVYRVPGTIEDPNSLSMYLCLTAPVLVAAATAHLPRYARAFSYGCIGVAMLTMILTVSRAGIPILALVMLGTAVASVSLRVTLGKVLALAVLVLAAAGLVCKSWDTLKARYGQATLEEEYLAENIEGRGFYLRLAKVIAEDRFFGVGLNNWSYWASKSYGAKVGAAYEDYDDLNYAPGKEILPSIHYAAPAHNLGALTLGELGIPGLMVFALVWLRWLQIGQSFLWRRISAPVQRLGVGFFFGVCGIFLQSLTEWVYRQTAIFITCQVLLGAMASLYQLKRQSKGRLALTQPAPDAAECELVKP